MRVLLAQNDNNDVVIDGVAMSPNRRSALRSLCADATFERPAFGPHRDYYSTRIAVNAEER